MRELREILRAWSALERSGETAVLGSVVHAEGSTYRRPGARVLVLPDERTVGLISGGCLEGDLLLRARRVRALGEPELVRYDGTAEDLVWGLGLGCAGIVDVLLEPVSSRRPGPLSFLARCLEERRPAVLATVLRAGPAGPAAGTHFTHPEEAPDPLGRAMEQVLREGRTRALDYEGARVLVEAIRPPVSLLVLGAGPDAVPVVRLANELGWDATVVDGRPAHARAEHFPGARAVLLAAPEAVADRVRVDSDTVALVMTHHYLHDRSLLRWLVATPARYVGVLGPRQRTVDLVRDLRGPSALPADDVLARLHAPAGLDLGSEAAEEIALSILAEIQAVLAGRRGGPLRDRKGPIHDPVA